MRDTTAATLRDRVQRNVQDGCSLFTDAHRGCAGLDSEYAHYVADHAVENVREQIIYSNGIECFLSLLKRSNKGMYLSVDVAHLDAYPNKQTFRFIGRQGKDADGFQKSLSQVAGKRLTFQELTDWFSQS